jgi:hypothetical protein
MADPHPARPKTLASFLIEQQYSQVVGVPTGQREDSVERRVVPNAGNYTHNQCG